jgi:hypothetical protein
MQNLGLSQDYQDSDREIGKCLKQSFGLHFSDPTEVEDCFVEDYNEITQQHCLYACSLKGPLIKALVDISSQL